MTIEELVFETYRKRTGEPSWVFEEFAAKVTEIVALRCAEIAMERCRLLNGDAMAIRRAGHSGQSAAVAEIKANQFLWMDRAIRREFGLPSDDKADL